MFSRQVDKDKNRFGLLTGVLCSALCLLILLVFLVGRGDLAAAQSSKNINWLEWRIAQAKSFSGDKPLIIYFNTPYCGACRMLERTIFSKDAVIQNLNQNFLSVNVDITKERELATQYRVRAVPTIYFLSPTGEALDFLIGVPDERTFTLALKYFGEGCYRKVAFDVFAKNGQSCR